MKRQTKRADMPRRQRRKRYVINVKKMTLSVLLLLLGIQLVMAACTSPLFYIRNKRVIGNRIVPKSDVLSRIKIANDANIFLVDKITIVSGIKKNPIVNDVRIYRLLPETLIIRIIERKPMFVLSTGEKLYEVDRFGIPFRSVKNAYSALPVISCNVPCVIVGKRPNSSVFNTAMKCLLLAKEKKKFRVEKLTVDQSQNLCLNVRDGYQVKLGQPDRIEEKLDIAARAVEQIPEFRQHGEYIDVSCPEAPAIKSEVTSDQ